MAIKDVDGADKTASLMMPFESGNNRRAQSARQMNADWLVRMGVLEPLDDTWVGVEKAAFHKLAGLVYKVEDQADLALITDFITFLFVFDDMVDSAASSLGTNEVLLCSAGEMLMMGVLGQPAFAGAADHLPIPVCHRTKLEGLQNALADITRRLLAIAGSRKALEHYIDSMVDYFDGNVREARIRRTETSQDVSSYAALRLSVSAVYPCLEIGAILRGVRVPDEVRSCPEFQEMRKACNLSVSYVNDLFSYRKEALAGETSNLLHVLKEAQGLSLQNALDVGSRICNQVVERYLSIASAHSWDEATLTYMSLMESWMRGNMDWYLEAKQRYDDLSSTDSSPTLRLASMYGRDQSVELDV